MNTPNKQCSIIGLTWMNRSPIIFSSYKTIEKRQKYRKVSKVSTRQLEIIEKKLHRLGRELQSKGRWTTIKIVMEFPTIYVYNFSSALTTVGNAICSKSRSLLYTDPCYSSVITFCTWAAHKTRESDSWIITVRWFMCRSNLTWSHKMIYILFSG